MSSPSEVTLPAWRLRARDVLPTYGPDQAVIRTPVISPDGSMVSALLAATPKASPRLVRVPVDQPVTVIRAPSEPDAKFVRATRVAKSSGARIAVLDLSHPESEIEPLNDAHYATLCISHHSLRFHTSATTADAQGSHPEGWCDGCAESSTTRDRHRVYGEPPPDTSRVIA